MDNENEILPVGRASSLWSGPEMPEGEEQGLSGQRPPEDNYKKRGGFGKGLLCGVLSTALVMTVMFVAVAGLYVHFTGGTSGLLSSPTRAKIGALDRLLDKYYYKDIDEDELVEGLYKGLVEGLDDPYSTYYSPEEYAQAKIDIQGNYGGIGAVLSQDKVTNEVSIVKVYDDSPAAKAGLKKDDLIVSVDGVKAADKALDDFVQLVRGKKGTSIELVYSRKGREKTVTLKREEIVIPSVSSKMLDNDIGLVEISEFSSNTQNEFDEAIASLRDKGMKAVIFDLRTNPGGLVDSVTEILDEILPEGTTVYMLDKQGHKTEYTSDKEHAFDIPIAVLTSQNTASAAEIFAGAIRDYDYGVLIGKNTYGKGVVQVTLPLTDGSALKVTSATYYTPNGESIHEKGIKPDIDLDLKYSGSEDDEEYDYLKDNQINRAIKELSKELGTEEEVK